MSNKPVAPRPGVSKRKEAAENAAKVWTITFRGESRSCAFNNLPFGERALIRRTTGLPLSAFTDTFDVDTAQVLWWVAGRASLDATLTLADVLEAWPVDFRLNEFVISDGAEDEDPEE